VVPVLLSRFPQNATVLWARWLGGVGLWVGVGFRGGVEVGGVAAEGVEDVDRGVAAVEELHVAAGLVGVAEERDQLVVFLEEVGAGLDRGLSRRLDALWGEEGWTRGAVEDRAAAGRKVVDDRVGLGFGLVFWVGVELFGAKRGQRARGR
jgi:hypothetical protein